MQRILVVDDERSIRVFIAAMLTKEGYVVDVASSGEESLALLQERQYDLLLVDLKMGEVDGLRVLAESKQLCPDASIVLLTGHGSLDSAIRALRLGASDYLLKPCSDNELKNCVKNVLARARQEARNKDLVSRVVSWVQESASVSSEGAAAGVEADVQPASSDLRRASPPTAIISVGDFVIDQQWHTVKMLGRPLSLTPTEYRLLLYLAENVDCPLSCQQIARQVYGYDCHEGEARHLVKLHIKNLRRKIERDPSKPRRLLNVRSVGYVLSLGPDS